MGGEAGRMPCLSDQSTGSKCLASAPTALTQQRSARGEAHELVRHKRRCIIDCREVEEGETKALEKISRRQGEGERERHTTRNTERE